MYIQSGQIIFSPSDITLYMESPFASWMEHLLAAHPELAPACDEADPLMKVLQNKGNANENAILSVFEAQGLSVVKINRDSGANVATIAAIKAGKDIIYQACLSKSPMKGYADFLVKIPGNSLLGDYHYEVWDIKLSKSLKPYFIIQLCCYAEMLEEIQGCFAESIVIVLGDDQKKYLRLDDYYHYYCQLKRNFLDFHENFDLNQYQDPMLSRTWGRWVNYKDLLIQKIDHLSQVATITKSQIKKLNIAGITTMQQLATTTSYVKGISVDVLSRLISQADLQKKSIGLDVPLFKIAEHLPSEKKGLALLPPLLSSDIFFDIEGAPLVDGGLEYLWGVSYFDESGERRYKDYWAHNQEQEVVAFKSFVIWVYERWQKNPGMHIYHYGNYEIAACRKLMSRHGACEYELDQLLRNEVFVDLYKIIKGSLLLGEPKYSIKNVEHLYHQKRDTEVGSGVDSIVFYENWRENPDGETWETSSILNNIRNYNIDDCNSTQELVHWLFEKQKENNIVYLGKKDIEEPEVKEVVKDRIKLRDRLLAKSHGLFEQGEIEEAQLSMNLAWLIEFNRRESKPVFWRLFDRLGLTSDELIDDVDCLGRCIRTDREPFKRTIRSKNLTYEYKFDPNQEFKATCKKYFVLEEDVVGKRKSLDVCDELSDLDNGYILLQAKSEPDKLINLIPDEYVPPDPIPLAITNQIAAYEEGHLGECAILDYLRRRVPRIRDHQLGLPIVSSTVGLSKLQQIINAIDNLDNSYLTIQGPPGAGKTYTAKHVITALLKKGKKIGISSNSHKAINNLLKGTVLQCKTQGVKAYFACTKETDDTLSSLGINIIENNEIANNLHGASVVGTTAWGFSRNDLAGKFDYLFVDEAGQVSVAYLVAMSQSAKNIILIGDQMQLGQPSQGCHPEESGLSVLDYLLHNDPAIPDHMGIFLDTTYRMHSAVNDFISGAIYEGKLAADPANDKQSIKVPENYKGALNKEAGIIYVPVEHEGNTQASDEEVEKIVLLINELLGRTYTDKYGETKNIDWNDILCVAPYNFQVNKLKSALGDRARVGSVDKFQGQEAPIVILSMCTSDANESPRGLNFLFDKNRINVAISRAKCLAIVVANSKLSETSVSDVEQLSKLNMFCRLISAGL